MKKNNEIQSKFNLSEVEFFLLILKLIPDGSYIFFDQTEPDNWVIRLQPWSYRSDLSQYEADYYIKNEHLVECIREILNHTPQDLNEIHHLYITSPGGESIFSSFDNFEVIYLCEELKIKIKSQINDRLD
ncbi:MAG: hypothetical protein ACP5FK_09900 [bacterium]